MAVPSGQVLGLSDSNIAPQIFMHVGDAIAKDLQRTGQEIAANVQRIQTNKQFQAFDQEAATLDPATPNYIPSLLGIASKYPLAAQSEGGQRLIQTSMLAHSPYMKERMAQQDFGRELEMEGLKHRNRMEEYGIRGSNSRMVEKDRYGRWVNTRTGEVVQAPVEGPVKLSEGQGLFTPEGLPIVEPLERTTATPFRMGNGFKMDATTGDLAPLPLNTNQEATLAQKNQALALREAGLAANSLRSEINGLNEEYKSTSDEARREDIKRRIDNRRSQLDTLLNVTANIPVQGPSQGAGPVAPVPVVPEASVLPPVDPLPVAPITPAPQPAPQFVPGKVYRDKAGNRRRYKDGGQWEVLP